MTLRWSSLTLDPRKSNWTSFFGQAQVSYCLNILSMSYTPPPKPGEMENKRSRKVWDNCESCFCELEISEKEWNWRRCSRCQKISFVLKATLCLGLVIVLWTLWKTTSFINSTLNIYTLGYVLDILGGWCLANGLTDLFLLAGSGWGGGSATFKTHGKKNYYFRSIGIFLLILGFIIQCIANILTNSPT